MIRFYGDPVALWVSGYELTEFVPAIFRIPNSNSATVSAWLSANTLKRKTPEATNDRGLRHTALREVKHSERASSILTRFRA